MNDKKNTVGDQIEVIEDLLRHSVNYINRFLHNQVDFSVLRNQAIQKAYKQELIDKQNKENNTSLVSKPNLSSNNAHIIRTETSLSKKTGKSVGFNLVDAN